MPCGDPTVEEGLPAPLHSSMGSGGGCVGLDDRQLVMTEMMVVMLSDEFFDG